MSRSRRHTAITGITSAASEKQDKRMAAGRLRMLARQALRDAPEDVVAPDRRLAGSPWTFAKDGKQYLRGVSAAKRQRLMRK